MDLSVHKLPQIVRLEWCGLLVDYRDVFIMCLDSHFDGSHSLQRIHWWASSLVLHFSKADEETNLSTSWMAREWINFHQIFIFGWTVSLRSVHADSFITANWNSGIHSILTNISYLQTVDDVTNLSRFNQVIIHRYKHFFISIFHYCLN